MSINYNILHAEKRKKTGVGLTPYTAVRSASKASAKKAGPSRNLPIFGADSRTRTDDLLITNQLLYQLSHISISRSISILHFFGNVKLFFASGEKFRKKRRKSSVVYPCQTVRIVNFNSLRQEESVLRQNPVLAVVVDFHRR